MFFTTFVKELVIVPPDHTLHLPLLYLILTLQFSKAADRLVVIIQRNAATSCKKYEEILFVQKMI